MKSIISGGGPDRLDLHRVRMIVVLISVILPAILVSVAYFQSTYHPYFFTRDPLAVVATLAAEGQPCCSPFTGAISTLGVIVWSGTGAVTLLAAILLKFLGARQPDRLLMTLASGLTAWMIADDAFMLHETFGPEILGFGLFNAIPILGSVAILAAACKARVWTDLPILLAALCALAMSLFIDDVIAGGRMSIFVEDAFKFLGICLWAAFFTLAAITCLLRAVAGPCRIDDKGTGTALRGR